MLNGASVVLNGAAVTFTVNKTHNPENHSYVGNCFVIHLYNF